MADQRIFEEAFMDRYRKYRQAIDQGDGYNSCYYFGALNNMRHVLEQEFKYTKEGFQGLINEAIKNG